MRVKLDKNFRKPDNSPPRLGDTGVPVNDQTKAAYRHLLYVAMLATRNYCQSRGPASRNPFVWRRQYYNSRIAGKLADWLHNLALFSSLDFAGFSEKRFWREHDSILEQYPDAGFERYREIFDEYSTGKRSVC